MKSISTTDLLSFLYLEYDYQFKNLNDTFLHYLCDTYMSIVTNKIGSVNYNKNIGSEFNCNNLIAYDAIDYTEFNVILFYDINCSSKYKGVDIKTDIQTIRGHLSIHFKNYSTCKFHIVRYRSGYQQKISTETSLSKENYNTDNHKNIIDAFLPYITMDTLDTHSLTVNL